MQKTEHKTTIKNTENQINTQITKYKNTRIQKYKTKKMQKTLHKTTIKIQKIR